MFDKNLTYLDGKVHIFSLSFMCRVTEKVWDNFLYKESKIVNPRLFGSRNRSEKTWDIHFWAKNFSYVTSGSENILKH